MVTAEIVTGAARIAASRCFALVPCAGYGERADAGQPKQYVQVGGRCVVAHTLSTLDDMPRLSATLVVLACQDERFVRELPHWGEGDTARRRWVAHCGGATRAASVRNGLGALLDRGAADDDWVLVHDAARCLLRAGDVERLIAACEADDVGGLLALPLADTLKREDAGGRAAATLERRGLWQAQTPQMFRIGPLRAALDAAGNQVTDEAGAMEAMGFAPRLVRGSPENFKLTWPADFALADRLLRTRA